MRYCKPFRFSLIAAAAIIMLLSAGSGAVLAQSGTPATQPNVVQANTSTAATKATSAADEDIRDIRPPIHIPYGWLWAIYVASGLALIGAMIAAWRLYRQLDRSRRKTLFELTLDELEAARTLMEPLKGYQFSIAVSEIIRNYIEKRFQVRAAHRTTQEFFHDLVDASHATLALHQPLLAEFLEHCDLAKFARWQLSIAQMEAMYRSARTFVIETGKTSVTPDKPANSHLVNAQPQFALAESSST